MLSPALGPTAMLKWKSLDSMDRFVGNNSMKGSNLVLSIGSPLSLPIRSTSNSEPTGTVASNPGRVLHCKLTCHFCVVRMDVLTS